MVRCWNFPPLLHINRTLTNAVSLMQCHKLEEESPGCSRELCYNFSTYFFKKRHAAQTDDHN